MSEDILSEGQMDALMGNDYRRQIEELEKKANKWKSISDQMAEAIRGLTETQGSKNFAFYYDECEEALEAYRLARKDRE